MINEDVAKQISAELDKDFPNATGKLGMKPVASTAAFGDKVIVTVTNDIEALKRKLDAIARGINLLKDQL
jgi:hypothetical protein